MYNKSYRKNVGKNKTAKKNNLKKRNTKRNRMNRNKSRKMRGGGFNMLKNSALMPMTVEKISQKVNALLVHLKVPFEFDDGYKATDYIISSTSMANTDNSGKGKLKDNAARGQKHSINKVVDTVQNKFSTNTNTPSANSQSARKPIISDERKQQAAEAAEKAKAKAKEMYEKGLAWWNKPKTDAAPPA